MSREWEDEEDLDIDLDDDEDDELEDLSLEDLAFLDDDVMLVDEADEDEPRGVDEILANPPIGQRWDEDDE